MEEHVYRHDKILSALTLALGVAIWGLATWLAVRLGGPPAKAAMLVMLALFAVIGCLGYLFARSAAIAVTRGNGIEVSEAQLPDIHGQFLQCCERLAISSRPHIYLQNGNGVLNAFATWFLGHRYVVLLSSVVDAMEGNPSGVRFYIGHELGHVLRHDNPLVWALRRPALGLPIVGAAFSRARESTCDLHGLACSGSREDAARSLLALSAGSAAWKRTSLESLRAQVQATGGFWSSFHELISSYPWTSKRVLRVLDERPPLPRRNPFAYIVAAFVPYAGRLGAGVGFFLYVYFIGLLASILIPAYVKNRAAPMVNAVAASQPARDAIASYYMANRQQPDSLQSIGISETAAPGVTLSLGQAMTLTVETPRGALQFSPVLQQGKLTWVCSGAPGTRRDLLPPDCR